MFYDYLIVGAGLYGSVFAYEANKRGKKCLVIDKRDHVAGNIYTKIVNDISVHYYGAHIFHTSDKSVWNYVNQFVEFNNFVNSPLANYKGQLYNLPFNMNTFNKLWGINSPQEARKIIEKQSKEYFVKNPQNLEEQALSLFGVDIYEKLIRGYTEKQWGRPCTEIPPFIIKRLPLRFTYDNNYFRDRFQGVPISGYTFLVEKLLGGIPVELNTNFYSKYREFTKFAKKLVFTGMIDEFYDHRFGILEYRSLHFEHTSLEIDNFQGNAVVNYTDQEIPYTRIIEHKHFEFGDQPTTMITTEYPRDWKYGDEPYYPINDMKNNEIYKKYYDLSLQEKNILFGGRLGEYKYYDMDKVIQKALSDIKIEFGN